MKLNTIAEFTLTSPILNSSTLGFNLDDLLPILDGDKKNVIGYVLKKQESEVKEESENVCKSTTDTANNSVSVNFKDCGLYSPFKNPTPEVLKMMELRYRSDVGVHEKHLTVKNPGPLTALCDLTGLTLTCSNFASILDVSEHGYSFSVYEETGNKGVEVTVTEELVVVQDVKTKTILRKCNRDFSFNLIITYGVKALCNRLWEILDNLDFYLDVPEESDDTQCGIDNTEETFEETVEFGLHHLPESVVKAVANIVHATEFIKKKHRVELTELVDDSIVDIINHIAYLTTRR